MALKPCRECGQNVSSEAPTCPACGCSRPVRHWGIFKIFFTTLFLFVAGFTLIGALAVDSAPTPQVQPKRVAEKPRSAAPPEPELKIKSWRCDIEENYTYVRGEVKNLTDQKIEHVLAVATYKNKAGELVKSDDALVEFDPLMPGQTSPFEVITRNNPEITNCELNFATMRGRQLIAVK